MKAMTVVAKMDTSSRKLPRSDTQIRHGMHGMQCMHVDFS